MKAKVILNPYANRWGALKHKDEVLAALVTAGIDHELVITEHPKHATTLARQAVLEGFSPIITAGGDGTVNEVTNGIMQAIESDGYQVFPPLGIMPLGTVNDLVVNLGMSRNLQESAVVIARGKTRMMDLAQVNGKYFGNNSAIGLEPSITLIQEDITNVDGVLRYLLAALKGVMRNLSWQAHLEWDSGSYSGLVSLVTVGNNPLTGGIFYMAPHADAFDGRLTFVYGYLPTRMQTLRLLPKTMKKGAGSYVEHPAIHEVHTKWLKIHTDSPTPLHTDGEILTKAVQDIDYQIFPAKIPILVNPM